MVLAVIEVIQHFPAFQDLTKLDMWDRFESGIIAEKQSAFNILSDAKRLIEHWDDELDF